MAFTAMTARAFFKFEDTLQLAAGSFIETEQFIGKADRVMSAAKKNELIDFIARNPKEGDFISGTGGVRKPRFAIQGKGKRGGSGLFIITITTGIQCCFLLCLEKTKNRI